MPKVAIALGSNLGDRMDHLRRAAASLADFVGLTGISRVYETAPMYVEDQPAYLNAVVAGSTDLGPIALLRRLKALEREIGRIPTVRYGPREIDLDLIVYGRLSLRSVECGRTWLQVPHPRVSERRFVLAPLAEALGDAVLPGMGSVQAMLERTSRQAADVRPLAEALTG
ncbi:MAG: 2-amino-4-hydroxy-6-hydroxymethyldihydropteridine diphosphokinase [Fimbriimonadaceae bacterium]